MKIKIICEENEPQAPIDVAMAIINQMRDEDISPFGHRQLVAYWDEVAGYIKSYTQHRKEQWEK